jgi:hypothetical protein
MYSIRTDSPTGLIEVDVAGELDEPDLTAFCADLRAAAARVSGPVRVLADLRAFRTRPTCFAELVERLQDVGRDAGVQRVAEVVADAGLAIALDARSGGAAAALRRFACPDAARAWLSGK